ncbi:MAG: DNA-binding response regulator [Methylobacterium sp.]|nr:MAG: DNA-binding response regulator [Methylobacterium sp.]
MSEPAPLVHIVDDEHAVRDSMAWLLQSRGIESRGYGSGEAFLEAYRADLDGVVILDIRMDGLSGLEVLDRLMERGATQPIIMLSGHADVPAAVAALKKGAVDFFEKPFSDNQMVDRILELHAMSLARRSERTARLAVETRLASLSEREMEVMERMIAGRLNKQIAGDLGIAMRTVEVHRARILEKMGVRNAVELAAVLGRAGSREEPGR